MIANVVLIITALLLGISNLFSRMILYPKTKTHAVSRALEIEKGDIDETFVDYIESTKQEIEIDTGEGYSIYAWWLPQKDAKYTIVFSHGITCNLYHSIKYMKPFYEWGFNVLLFDQKNHGKSGGKYTTFGYEEREDLVKIVDWVQCHTEDDTIIGTHGESMGASIAILHGAIDPRIDFIISDCGYESATSIFQLRLNKDFHLPSFPFLYLSSGLNYLKTGAYFKDISPINAAKNIKSPILFIHGEDDVYVPPYNSVHMFDASIESRHREIKLIKGARHAQAFSKNPQAYIVNMQAFVECVLDDKLEVKHDR